MLRSTRKTPRLLDQVARWWRDRMQQRGTVAALADCGLGETARIARDIGISTGAELRVLASKWPSSADLLGRRLQQMTLDPAVMARSEPEVARDLQRVCSLCASKRRCSRDLARGPFDSAWQTYCPNATTLRSLIRPAAADADGA
jgi:hypothetical protein